MFLRLRAGFGIQGCLGALACVLLAVPVCAQQTATDTTVLTGCVIDASGRPDAHVRVTAQLINEDPEPGGFAAPIAIKRERQGNAPLAPRQVALTDSHGNFAFLRLRPGTYILRVEIGPVASPLIITEAGAVFLGSEPAYVLLQDGSKGDPGMLLHGLSVTSSLASQPAQPPLSESPDEALVLAEPTTAPESSPGDRADTPEENESQRNTTTSDPQATNLSAGVAGTDGIAVAQSRVTLDGLSADQFFRSGPRGNARGGPSTGALFARGAVRSLRAGPGTYSAASGSMAGISAGTQSGAKGLHGGAFLTLRESAFDAANPYAIATHYRNGAVTSGIVKPEDSDVQAGAHIGFVLPGHSLHEKAFGFVSLEGRVRNAPIESTPAVANFYTLTSTQRALLGTRGVSATEINTALNYLDSLSGEIPRSDTRLLSFARLDLRAKEHDAVAFTFSGNHFHSPAGAAFGQLADAVVASGRGTVGDSALDAEAIAAHWSHRFTPKLQNTAAAQFAHDLESERPRAPLSQEPAISPNGEAPEVEIAPEGFTYGTPANLDRTAYPDEQRVQVTDTLRWLLGKHVFSLGAEWSRIADRIDSLRNENGTFLYDSGATNGRAGGLVDWITDATFNVHAYPNGGCPTIFAATHDFCFRTYTQSFGNSEQQFTTHDVAGFAEDTFFATPTLRLTLGARYEYTLLPIPQVPNTGLDATLSALTLPAPLRGTTGAYPEDRNNAGPRLGLAWSPHSGHWFTAHLGYGWFFGRLPGTTLRAALADNGLATGIQQVRITPTTETPCPQVANQGFGYPCAFSAAPPSAVAQTGSAMFFSDHFRLPAIQRASLAIERAIGPHITLELGYNGAWAMQLPTSVDTNIIPAATNIHYTLQGGATLPGLSTGRAFAVPLYTARRLTNLGPITAITSQANATYHAGQLTARLRSWRGLEARGTVVFSRAIDTDPQIGATPRTNGMFDPFAIGYDKGLSNQQIPIRFGGELVAHTTLKRGPASLRHALTGFRAAATATAASGAPYSYQIFGGTRLSGGYDSINGAGGATYLPTVGRNTLRLPARANVDLRLERAIDVRAVKLSAFAEAFNLLNQRNLSRLETRAFLLGTPANGATPLIFQDAATVAAEGITTPAFGTPTSSTGSLSRERLVAVGLRLQF